MGQRGGKKESFFIHTKAFWGSIALAIWPKKGTVWEKKGLFDHTTGHFRLDRSSNLPGLEDLEGLCIHKI